MFAAPWRRRASVRCLVNSPMRTLVSVTSAASFTLRPRSTEQPFRMAIVGSGPAGFYTAYRIMAKLPNAYVDMYESLPVPFGLVRYGVAPDHPEVKNCQEKFDEVASSARFRFIGNASVGSSSGVGPCHIPLQTLLHHYDSLLLAYGASEDRKLGIPGESSLRGIHSAREFVGWYNGLPVCSGLDPALDEAEEAVIIGQGNVALDVARILLEDVKVLQKSDISEAALSMLSKSRIKKVHVVGRRGYLQAAFTIKEVREMMNLSKVSFLPANREFIPENLKELPRARRRLMEVIIKGSAAGPNEATKTWSLDNCLSPLSFVGSDSQTVSRTEFNVMRLVDPYDPASKITATGETTTLPSNIVFRSVGYKSVGLADFRSLDIPFDEARGILHNDGVGRVIRRPDDSGAATSVVRRVGGIYCAGWVKTGPTGVIASTMQDSFITAEAVVHDWLVGARFLQHEQPSQWGWDAVKAGVGNDANRTISWDQWRQIDGAERERGKERGKEREKFTSVEDMLSAVR